MIGPSHILAAGSPIEHVADKAWEWSPRLFGGHVLTAQVATMALAALVLVGVLVPAARARALRPKGRGYNLVEVFVLFVRDFIARPALHDSAYRFLPFLLTVFFFILACNLLGLMPLLDVSEAIPFLHGSPIGTTPTGNIWTTGALAAMVLAVIVVSGVAAQVRQFVDRGRSPVLGWSLGLLLYVKSLAPHIPGPIGLILAPVLIVLELIGVLAKCFALAIRLFANMSAGHILLAVLLGFALAAQHAGAIGLLVVPTSIAGAVAISLLELLVAFIQAFIFTFLTALFIGMAVHPHH